MTRSDLIAALARRFPSLVEKDAEIAVKEVLEAISEALRYEVIVWRFGDLVALA